jgi:hypothetical protein
MEVHTMRPAPLRPAAAVSTAAAQPQRYLTNDEAADYLRLSPRTLEKQRVIGGGPRFRKFGRRVMYAVADLDAWAADRSFESDFRSRVRRAPLGGQPCALIAGARVAIAMSSPRCRPGSGRCRSANSSTCSAPCRATWRRATART